MKHKDKLRAVKLKQVARRMKDGSTRARSMSRVKRAAEAEREHRHGDMTDPKTLRLDQLRAEARYHRQRADLYRARLHGGRAVDPARLEELQRASDRAAERLRQAQVE